MDHPYSTIFRRKIKGSVLSMYAKDRSFVLHNAKVDNGCLGRICRGRTYMAAIFIGEEP